MEIYVVVARYLNNNLFDIKCYDYKAFTVESTDYEHAYDEALWLVEALGYELFFIYYLDIISKKLLITE